MSTTRRPWTRWGTIRASGSRSTSSSRSTPSRGPRRRKWTNDRQEGRRGAGKLRLQSPRGHPALRPGPARREREAAPPGGVARKRQEPAAQREDDAPGEAPVAARGARPHLPRAERPAAAARRGGGGEPELLTPVLRG